MATLVQPRGDRPRRLFETTINLSEEQRVQTIDLLNAHLADSTDLKTQAKHAHWNVKGIQFFQLHELFDLVATHLEAHTDLLAERIAALGGVAHGTVRQVAASSSIEEYDLAAVKGEDHVRALTRRLAKHADRVRNAVDSTGEIGDLTTQDMLTGILQELDKDRWFLEAHLQA